MLCGTNDFEKGLIFTGTAIQISLYTHTDVVKKKKQEHKHMLYSMYGFKYLLTH